MLVKVQKLQQQKKMEAKPRRRKNKKETIGEKRRALKDREGRINRPKINGSEKRILSCILIRVKGPNSWLLYHSFNSWSETGTLDQMGTRKTFPIKQAAISIIWTIVRVICHNSFLLGMTMQRRLQM